ncbi:MAG TPA: M56 family metallopeptidase [Edaphobacter sp.]|nr:M56 family metallopeptidase [Edaphobacter sp.]
MEIISRSLLTFLLNSLWQIPLAAGVGALICWLMRNGPARNRYALWVAALAIAVTLPLASIISKERPPTKPFAVLLPQPDVAIATPAPQVHSASSTRALSPAPIPRTISLTETAARLLLDAYLLLIFLRLFGLVFAAVRTIQIRRTAQPLTLSEQLECVYRRCMETFNLTGVRLLFSATIRGPVTVGHAIILPESLLTETTEDILVTAVGHEMAHIARRDFLFNVLFELLCVPVSVQPAIWLIRRGIQNAREMACDELVTEKLLGARTYARALLRMATAMTAVSLAGYSLGVFDGGALEDRIRRLLERRPAHCKGSRLLLVTGFSALALCAVMASGMALTARTQGFATGVITQGEAANKRGDYQEAVRQFTRAVQLEPTNLDARLLLAEALLAQYLPGMDAAPSPLVAAARQQYLEVLARDSGSKRALHGMLSLSTSAKQFADAHKWALKAIQADRSDKFAYYTAGFVDWATTWPDYASARQAAGMQRQTPGIIPDAGLRQIVRAQHLAQIEDGLNMLDTALQLDPDYSDAMEYGELLYRMQAAIVDTNAESADLTAQANHWATQASEAKRRNPHSSPSTPRELAAAGTISEFAPPPPPPPAPPPPPGWHGTLPAPPVIRPAQLVIPEVTKTGLSGLVQLGLVIAKDGTVRQIDVLTGPPPLATPIVAAVRNWVFQPTVVDGEPVEITTMFNLRIQPLPPGQ